MKKISLLILSVLIIAVVCFIPVKQQKTINIKAQFFITIQQLLQPNNWKKWQPEVKRAWEKDSAQVKVSWRNPSFRIQIPGSAIHVTVAGLGFNVDKNSIRNGSYQFLIMPSTKDATTNINLSEKMYLWQKLMAVSAENTEDDIDALKAYLEDTRRYYGFDIKRTTVTDSNVVVEKRMILLQNKAAEIARTEQNLREYIRRQNLKIVQPIIADLRDAGKDSLRLMIGFPVNKQTVSNGRILFMHLPPHGRMLTGLYNGKYGGRQKLYLAMKTYMADHNLSSPEDPYEKYLDNKIPISDTDFVRLQVNFPIY